MVSRQRTNQLLVNAHIDGASIARQWKVLSKIVQSKFAQHHATCHDESDVFYWASSAQVMLFLSILFEIEFKQFGLAQEYAQSMVQYFIAILNTIKTYLSTQSYQTTEQQRLYLKIGITCEQVLLGEVFIVDAIDEIGKLFTYERDILQSQKNQTFYKKILSNFNQCQCIISGREKELSDLYEEHHKNIKQWLDEGFVQEEDLIEIHNAELHRKYKNIRHKMLWISGEFCSADKEHKEVVDIVALTLSSRKYSDIDAINNVRDILNVKNRLFQSQKCACFITEQNKQIKILDTLPAIKKPQRKMSYVSYQHQSEKVVAKKIDINIEEKYIPHEVAKIDLKNISDEEKSSSDISPRQKLESILREDILSKANDQDYFYLNKNAVMREKFITHRIDSILGVESSYSYNFLRKFSEKQKEQHNQWIENVLNDNLTMNYMKSSRADTKNYNILCHIIEKLKNYKSHVLMTISCFTRAPSIEKIHAVERVIHYLQTPHLVEEKMYQVLVDLIKNDSSAVANKIKADRNIFHGWLGFFAPHKTCGEELLEEVEGMVPTTYRRNQ